MRVAFDMSSVMWTALLADKDREGLDVEFEGKKVHVNRAEHGYENAVNLMLAAMREAQAAPIDCTLVFEGMHAKRRRLTIDNGYKANRGNRPEEAYIEFNRLRDMLAKVWLSVGANALTQGFVEGDDLLAWLAHNAEEPLMIVSNDNDLVCLAGPNRFGVAILVRCGGEVGVNKYGPFDPKLITTYKALVGDTSDSIKGCPGFGKVTFMDFVAKYGEDGLSELQTLLESSTLEPLNDLPPCKVLDKIRNEPDAVLRSYRLARLYPEWCDTVKLPVQWTAGVVKQGCEDERLAKYAGKLRLVEQGTYEPALAFLQSKLSESPFVAFDIETSTPDESDEWLSAQGNPDGVDVIGSYLVGFSLTFGRNTQYTYYVSVKHADSDNISMVQARQMLEAVFNSGKEIVIQNVSFELSVLYQAKDEDGTLWRDHWKDNGYQGFIPRVLDTKIEANYVDENLRSGLKDRSALHLGYVQQTFKDVTTIEGKVGTLPSGEVVRTFEKVVQPAVYGAPISVHHEADEEGRDAWVEEVPSPLMTPAVTETWEAVKYKMHELSAAHVFNYGADDALCSAALHNWYKLVMQTEHTYNVYKMVELDAAYLHAYSFVRGVKVSMRTMQELSKEDDEIYDKALVTFQAYLVEQKWEGTVPPVYTCDITPAQVKEAFFTVFGRELEMAVRKPARILEVVRDKGDALFAGLLERLYEGSPEDFTKHVQSFYKNVPAFNDGSTKQMQKLLYEVMGLPVRVRNKLTATMRQNGVTQGTAKTDSTAIGYALLDATAEQKPILEALRLLAMVGTRRSLYYNTYPNFVHWLTGRIHSSHNQSATVTRRASSSGPNVQQLPVTAKIEGTQAKFRSTIVPHKRKAVILSLDFAAQELLSMAFQSQDPAMLSAYVGDNLRDLHLVTAVEILKSKYRAVADWTYAYALSVYEDPSHEHHSLVKRARTQGKAVNFAGQYNVGSEKLGIMLRVSKDDAQSFLDAKARAFPLVERWKTDTEDAAKRSGKAYTLLGAIRHLAPLLNSEDKFVSSKASRQAINYRIQGSCGEQTKLAEGAIWRSGVLWDYDCEYYFPVHDETVFSAADEHAWQVAQKVHRCMTQPYGGMTVPITSSIGLGRDFYNLKEIGTTLTEEKFSDALEAM